MFLPMSCTSPLTVAIRILPALWRALAAVGLLLRLHVGQQQRDRLFHHARRFDDLRQEHFAGAEQVADDVHAGHQRAFDDISGRSAASARLLGVGVDVIR